MTYRNRVRLMILMSSLHTLHPIMAAEAPSQPLDELSFFDYLGALVESEQGWVDPLHLLEDEGEAEVEQVSDSVNTVEEAAP